MEEYRIIIAGSRTFADYEYLKSNVDQCIKNLEFFGDKLENITIVSGEAQGADKLGEKYANEKRFPVLKFPADWQNYGHLAGYIRNRKMAENSDCLIAFWDGESKGTKDMIFLAQQYNLEIFVISFPNKTNQNIPT